MPYKTVGEAVAARSAGKLTRKEFLAVKRRIEAAAPASKTEQSPPSGKKRAKSAKKDLGGPAVRKDGQVVQVVWSKTITAVKPVYTPLVRGDDTRPFTELAEAEEFRLDRIQIELSSPLLADGVKGRVVVALSQDVVPSNVNYAMIRKAIGSHSAQLPLDLHKVSLSLRPSDQRWSYVAGEVGRSGKLWLTAALETLLPPTKGEEKATEVTVSLEANLFYTAWFPTGKIATRGLTIA